MTWPWHGVQPDSRTLDPIQGRQARDFFGPVFTSYGPKDFGFPIRSIEIDNPTGQWLLLAESVIRIPPYTINFRVNIDPSAQTIAIKPIPVQGWANTQVGSTIRVAVRDYEVPPSQGISLISTDPTTQSRQLVNVSANTTGDGSTIFATPATQSVRLYAAHFGYARDWTTADKPLHPIIGELSDNAGNMLAPMNLNAEQPSVSALFGPGLDVGTGRQLIFFAYSAHVQIVPGDGDLCTATIVFTVI